MKRTRALILCVCVCVCVWQGYNPVEYLEFFANRDYQVAFLYNTV